MKHTPLVSINIRTYNSAKTLEKTFISIKKQTYPNIEVIVSDGYSKDESVKIAKSYNAKINYADKLGDARFNNYKQSKGKYILSLDSDQILDKKVVEECVLLCEYHNVGAVIISEKSLIQKGTLVEKLIAYDKWVIDQNKDFNPVFGTACPRFFKKELFLNLKWPEELAVFDDTILYNELFSQGAKISYLSSSAIWHHEVTSWSIFIKKFFRYGKGYGRAIRVQPATIVAHSLPRRSYFSRAAFSRPHYFLGLLLLYSVKASAATAGAISGILTSFFSSK